MLEQFCLFSCLDAEELEALEKVAAIKTFPKNTVLFSEGDPSDSFYAICNGKVSVGIYDEDGREVILSFLGPGDYFGEMALVDDEPRSALVMTRENSELLVISKKDFKNILETSPGITLNLLKGILKRLREANKKIESLALMNVYGRVARLLTQMAGEDNSVIEDRLTHQDIASMIGASREMVSRVLKDLDRNGYISIQKKRIFICKKLPCEY